MHDDQFEQFDETQKRIEKMRTDNSINISEENSIKLKHSFIKLLLVIDDINELTDNEKIIIRKYSKQVIKKLDWLVYFKTYVLPDIIQMGFFMEDNYEVYKNPYLKKE